MNSSGIKTNSSQELYETLKQKRDFLLENYAKEPDVAVSFQIKSQIENIQKDIIKLESSLAKHDQINTSIEDDITTNETISMLHRTIYYDDWFNKLNEEFVRCESKIIRIIQADNLLNDLESYKRINTIQKNDKVKKIEPDELITKLNSIKIDIKSVEEPSQLLQSFNSVKSNIKMKIEELNSKFIGYIYQSIGNIDFFENLISKIGHTDLKKEAETHLRAINSVLKRYDFESLYFDILNDNSYKIMNILVQIENERTKIEKLLEIDRKRQNKTLIMVIVYILTVIVGFIVSMKIYNSPLIGQNQLLTPNVIPIIGIPWAVIIWSLIGSFAAMIHQFNKNPIYNFGETIKWMLTRPVQGVVLGSTFYLVLISGLFLFTGTTEIKMQRDEIILVLSFLVGFSDRFADQIFNSLIQKYTKTLTDKSNSSNEKELEIQNSDSLKK